MSGLQDVRDVLHEIVAATAGGGVAERLHGLIDGLGAPAPSYPPAAEPAPAEPAPAEPEPAPEPFPAPAETPAPAAPPEQAWTTF